MTTESRIEITPNLSLSVRMDEDLQRKLHLYLIWQSSPRPATVFIPGYLNKAGLRSTRILGWGNIRSWWACESVGYFWPCRDKRVLSSARHEDGMVSYPSQPRSLKLWRCVRKEEEYRWARLKSKNVPLSWVSWKMDFVKLFQRSKLGKNHPKVLYISHEAANKCNQGGWNSLVSCVDTR